MHDFAPKLTRYNLGDVCILPKSLVGTRDGLNALVNWGVNQSQ